MYSGTFLSIASAIASESISAVFSDEAPSVNPLCSLQSCGAKICLSSAVFSPISYS